MRRRTIVRLVLIVLALCSLIPVFMAVIPPPVSKIVKQVVIYRPNSSNSEDGLNVQVEVTTPKYLRKGMTGFVKLIIQLSDPTQQIDFSTQMILHLRAPVMPVNPRGEVKTVFSNSTPVKCTWDLKPTTTGLVDGTLWIYQKEMEGNDPANNPQALLAIPLHFITISFLRLDMDLAAFLGGMGFIVSLVIYAVVVLMQKKHEKTGMI